jgi:hypothetical protein
MDNLVLDETPQSMYFSTCNSDGQEASKSVLSEESTDGGICGKAGNCEVKPDPFGALIEAASHGVKSGRNISFIESVKIYMDRLVDPPKILILFT